MGSYLRTIGMVLTVVVMAVSIYTFINYYQSVASLKQDNTYKQFMYNSLNKGNVRLNGAGDLYAGDISGYYADENGNYQQLNYEIIKQIALNSKIDGEVEYQLLYNTSDESYYLHVKNKDVDSVLRFSLEQGV